MVKVKVYTTHTCPWCDKLKEWLKENNVEFEEIDVGRNEKTAQDMIEKSGQMSVPVTEIDGQMVIGFDTGKLKRLLKIK